ncbi:Uncharacterized conserved protein YjiS, DUF1127 family [Ruegeria lacuscaerulensis ITI-1157]|nr:Uncharacterized conserved protein YjiS, DUF1127 family [Ruegeria lacuscaerulensis ITI-1157]
MTQIAVPHPRPMSAPRQANWLQHVFSVARQRRALGRLDERALRDIGVTRSQAEAEAARPIWDVSEYWQKTTC